MDRIINDLIILILILMVGMFLMMMPFMVDITSDSALGYLITWIVVLHQIATRVDKIKMHIAKHLGDNK